MSWRLKSYFLTTSIRIGNPIPCGSGKIYIYKPTTHPQHTLQGSQAADEHLERRRLAEMATIIIHACDLLQCMERSRPDGGRSRKKKKSRRNKQGGGRSGHRQRVNGPKESMLRGALDSASSADYHPRPPGRSILKSPPVPKSYGTNRQRFNGLRESVLRGALDSASSADYHPRPPGCSMLKSPPPVPKSYETWADVCRPPHSTTGHSSHSPVPYEGISHKSPEKICRPPVQSSSGLCGCGASSKKIPDGRGGQKPNRNGHNNLTIQIGVSVTTSWSHVSRRPQPQPQSPNGHQVRVTPPPPRPPVPTSAPVVRDAIDVYVENELATMFSALDAGSNLSHDQPTTSQQNDGRWVVYQAACFRALERSSRQENGQVHVVRTQQLQHVFPVKQY